MCVSVCGVCMCSLIPILFSPVLLYLNIIVEWSAIAAMVVFMCDPETSFTTGFCFDATGGRSVY